MPITDPGFAELRPFYCPIEPAIHPEVDRVEARAIEWVDRFGFYDNAVERARILGTRSAEFYARFAPEAPRENLQAAVHWVYWGFAFDDARCDNGPLSTRAGEFVSMACNLQRDLEAPHEAPLSEDSFALALHDIGMRFRQSATPVQMRRFSESHRAWLQAVAWQISNGTIGHMPDLNEYVTLRMCSSGGPPTLAMLEMVNGQEVPASDMDSPPVRALTEMAWLIAAFDNDMHSYHRELRGGYTQQNIISVYVYHEGCSGEEALLRATALRDRVMYRFLELREKLLGSSGPALSLYLRSLGHAIRGNIDWGIRSPRYTGLEESDGSHTMQGARRSHCTDEPSDPNPEPPNIPSINWWWNVHVPA
jgi:hypothetical protein